MLLQLPSDLLISVFIEFIQVDLKGLAAVDMAVCNHGLRDGHWLPLLPTLRLTESQRLSNRLNYLFSWLDKRGVQMTKILVEMGDVDYLDGPSRLYNFPATSELLFAKNNFSSSSFGLTELLTMFSSITVLNLSDCPSFVDHQLLELLTVSLPQLKRLDLRGCKAITPAVAVAVTRHFCQSLESLGFDALDDEAVWKLAKFPPNKLTALGISLDKLTNEASLMQLCDNNPNLKQLELRATTKMAFLTVRVVEQITCCCAFLTTLRVDPFPADYSILPIIADYCEDIEVAKICGVTIAFQKSADGSRTCGVTQDHDTKFELDVATIFAVLSNLSTFRVHCVGDSDRVLPISREAMSLVSSTFGAYLLEFNVYLMKEVTRNDIIALLKKCPMLTAIRLARGFGDRNIVDDNLLCLLPRMCPHITKLQLKGCAQGISDQTIIATLEGNQSIKRSKHQTTLPQCHGLFGILTMLVFD